MIRVEQHASGPRVFLLGRRWHHWESGVALMLFGAWLVFDDRRDLPYRRMLPEVVAPLFDPEIGVTTSHGAW